MHPPIPLARPELGDEEALAARRAILSGWVTQGPEVAAFEAELAAALGAPHACALSSGTAALHLALRALGVGPGDEVITASHSFVATANSIRLCGAVPVFVDVEPGTFNLDAKLVGGAISGNTKAILAVHQLGMPCDLPALLAHGLPVVEDAACAIGSQILVGGSWQRIGKPHGVAACFSFHPRKLVTTGDGGAVLTADAKLDAAVRRLRAHALVGEEHVELAWNYRLSDINAAVGRAQLARLDGMIAARRALADRYRRILGGLVGLPVEPAWARSNWQSFCVRLPDGVEQKRAMARLSEDGIACRTGVRCAHREPAYRHEPWRAGSTLVESERAQDRCLIIPFFVGMTDEQQDRVKESLRSL